MFRVCCHGSLVLGSQSCRDVWLSGFAVDWIRFISLRVGSFARSTEAFLAASLVFATMFRAVSRFMLPTMALWGSTTKSVTLFG